MTITPTNPPAETAAIRTFPVPPEGFLASQATPATLINYGLPRRPDDDHPDLQARWDDVLGRPLTHIVPEFRPMAELVPGLSRVHPAGGEADTTNSHWSGGVVTIGGDSFDSVSATWTVPDVAPPAGTGNGSWYSLAWIGIDGWGSNDVCQIGTLQGVTRSGSSESRTFYVWTEWYPNSWVAISNFPVNSGDEMSGLVCVYEPTAAVFNLVNVTTGARTGFTFTAPKGTTISGDSAEWILERPSFNNVLAQLPNYGEVFFDATSAGTKNDAGYDVGEGFLVSMFDDSGATVSVPTRETATLLKVAYD